MLHDFNTIKLLPLLAFIQSENLGFTKSVDLKLDNVDLGG